jgi:UDP-glucose 4-epimerase
MSAARSHLLLVGAGGFVGPWLARAALGAGWSVTGLSRRATANYGPGYTHIAVDATDSAACRPWLAEADAAIYNAAYIPTDFASPAEAEACWRHNAQAPLALLQQLVGRSCPFVYISSAQGYIASGRPALECDPVFPSAHAPYYLSSKLLGDIHTEHFRLKHGVPTAVLRLGSLYGPGLHRGMISHFVGQALAGRPITLTDGGRHQADLTFVGDAGSAAIAVLERRAKGIFNIGSGCATSARTAAQLVLAAAGRLDDLMGRELCDKLDEASGFAALNITRARSELGYAPTSSADGLARTVKEWVSPDPYR